MYRSISEVLILGVIAAVPKWRSNPLVILHALIQILWVMGSWPFPQSGKQSVPRYDTLAPGADGQAGGQSGGPVL